MPYESPTICVSSHKSAENDIHGLEIGFHVPSLSRGHVITRLGRDTDLILRHSYSAVHVAFEIHPETRLVMLSVRSKGPADVTVATIDQKDEDVIVDGDCVILYGQNYGIRIASYVLLLVWRKVEGPDPAEAFRALAMSGYEDSLRRLRGVPDRNLSIPIDTSALACKSYYVTKLAMSNAPHCPRVHRHPCSHIEKLVFRGIQGARCQKW